MAESMMGGRDKAKRWRPKWSVRTLLLVVTLGCAYLASWSPTSTSGITDVAEHVDTIDENIACRAPLMLEFTTGSIESSPRGQNRLIVTNHYYFWFFGYVAKLRYTRQVERPISSAVIGFERDGRFTVEVNGATLPFERNDL